MRETHLPRHGPRYATGMERPNMHAARFTSHKFLYVLPSTPHTKRDGLTMVDFIAGSYGGQVIEHVTQCGIKF